VDPGADLRLPRIIDGEADTEIAPRTALLAPSGGSGDEQVAAVPADPTAEVRGLPPGSIAPSPANSADRAIFGRSRSRSS
jgi:hypothetical protein